MILRAREFLVYVLKNKDGDFTSTFKWTDDKLTNLIKCLQEFKSSPNENLDENVRLPVSKSTPINNKKKKIKNNISINNPGPKLIDNKRKHLERHLRFVFAAFPV